MAAKLDGLRKLVALDFPREAFPQPGIGFFDLVAIVDALVEHAVVVTDAVADDGQRQRCAAIEKAGCQPSEAAIAQAGVPLAVEYVFQVQAEPAKRLSRFIFDADPSGIRATCN
jgi:hypothetical protein